MKKTAFIVLMVFMVLFFCTSPQAQELKESKVRQLSASEDMRSLDASSVPSDTTHKPTPESVLADTTIIVPLLDFKDVEIRDILNSLAKAYKLNLWLDPSITGKTTVYFEKVPLNDILLFA